MYTHTYIYIYKYHIKHVGRRLHRQVSNWWVMRARRDFVEVGEQAAWMASVETKRTSIVPFYIHL